MVLFTVCAPARSGTMWFSRLFTTGRVHCFHELAPKLLDCDTHDPRVLPCMEERTSEAAAEDFARAQRRTVLECLPRYFPEHWQRAWHGNSVVGNSDSYVATRFASGLGLVWPSMRFLFSFRDGINAVNSRFVWRAHYAGPRLAEDAARFGTTDFFEQCCHWWVWAVGRLGEHRSWLQSHGCSVLETRLEGVTTGVAEMERVWSYLIGDWPAFADHACALMARPANARVNVARVVTAAETWEAWSEGQRESFGSIAGVTQLRLGYELPPASGSAGR